MIPTFFLGVIIFVLILLMFQALRLTEFVLVHGVKVSTVTELMAYLSISFLPALFPMSLLFTVILTYGRMSADSEIVAFKACGLSMRSIIMPAFVFSILIALLSAQTAFHIAPWGNRQFEVMFTKLGSQRPGMTIKEGTFAEGFFDLVVYANHVNPINGMLEQVFIFDESNPTRPVTVIAKEGRLLVDPDKPGHQALMRLSDGDIHQNASGRHSKVHFNEYDIKLTNPVAEAFRKKSPQSLTLDELQVGMKDPQLDEPDRRRNIIEFNKRLALSVACILFALVGVGLSTSSNRRTAKGGEMVMCIGLIVVYWVVYVATENLAKQGTVPAAPAIWTANLIFAIAAVFSLRRTSR